MIGIDVEGLTVVVTGASGVLGTAIARGFLILLQKRRYPV
jgi:NAD(P)-dependent dehydrogenase (short-subunit alcohol dehydrogenase family)